MLAQRVPDRGRLDGASAEREHRGAAVAERVERGLCLEQSELQLATLLEQLRDRLLQRPLELPVEIDEAPAEPRRHQRAERGLARAHEADQRDVSV